jgi:hypothetical protein
MNKTVRDFSAGYYVIDADVKQYSGETVAAPEDYVADLMEYVDQPLLKLGSSHYWLTSQWGIPANTVAVPDHAEVPEDSPVLMAKDREMMDLLLSGGVDR